MAAMFDILAGCRRVISGTPISGVIEETRLPARSKIRENGIVGAPRVLSAVDCPERARKPLAGNEPRSNTKSPSFIACQGLL